MSKELIANVIRSKWFGAACYIILGALVLALIYNWVFVRGKMKLEMNMSCFAFRDINRNGIYDMEDRPYAGLKVIMDRPKSRDVESRSNLAGFANFKMRFGDRKAPISVPGDYEITIEPPEGWMVTTDNSVQTSTYREEKDAPVGMVASHTFSHVGVAPILTISGSVGTNVSEGEGLIEMIEAIAPDGSKKEIQLSDTGTFAFDVFPGKWRLDIITKTGKPVSRECLVISNSVVVSRISLGSLQPPMKAKREVVGFDDLTPSDTLYEVPNGYNGLNWNNWVATHHKLYGKSSHVNSVVSSEYLAYTSGGHPAVISAEKPFDFVGTYVTIDEIEGENHEIVINAWRGTDLAYEDRWKAPNQGPVFFDADYRSVTKIEFSNVKYWHVNIDDAAFRFGR